MPRAEVETILGEPPAEVEQVFGQAPEFITPLGRLCRWKSRTYWIQVHFDEDGHVLGTSGSPQDSFIDMLRGRLGL